MYTNAKKFVGKWAIFLKSQAITVKTVPQFSSLSRKLANEWAKANEPLPAAYTLNSSSGNAVWRGR